MPRTILVMTLTMLATPAAAQAVAEQDTSNAMASPPTIMMPVTQRTQQPDGVDWSSNLPSLRALDGNFTLRPLLRLDADAGSFFGQEDPNGFRSGVNLRRGRLGLRGALLQDFTYNVTWEFGGSNPADYNNIYEAQIAYTGLGWGTVRAGAFTPQHLPEYSGSSFDLLFLERAAISNIASSVASGDTRVAVGLEAHGPRWVASFYGSDGVLSTYHDDRQRGLVGRAAALAIGSSDVQLQVGLNVAWQLEPGTTPGPNSASFADYPELRVDSRRILNTRAIVADSTHAWGPELAGRAGPVYFEALYQRVGADAENGGAREFSGWYIAASVPLLGPARERDAVTGTWERPQVPNSFNPLVGHWGSLELAGRYSTVNLQSNETRGGTQSIWTLGLNWLPVRTLRLSLQYENGQVGRDGSDRDFQAISMRAALSL
jgi:phosphate-selective porin OprO/OprP